MLQNYENEYKEDTVLIYSSKHYEILKGDVQELKN